MAVTADQQAIGAGSQFTGADASTGRIVAVGGADWKLHSLALNLGSDAKTSWTITAVYSGGGSVVLLQGGGTVGDYPLNSQHIVYHPDTPLIFSNGDYITVITVGAAQAMKLDAKTEAA